MLAVIVAVTALGMVFVGPVFAQQGGNIASAVKVANPPVIGPNDTTTVSLQLVAESCGAVVTPRANVALVIDSSGSMVSFGSTKLRDARIAAASFVDQLQDNDRVSVTQYGTSPFTNVQLTDVGPLRGVIRDIILNIRSGGNNTGTNRTDTSVGLINAEANLQAAVPGEPKTIILLSDGGSNTGDPVGVAEDLKNSGITIYTIGLDVSAGSSAENELRSIATTPTSPAEQYYFRAAPADLNQIYSQISGRIVRGGPIGVNATWVETFDDTWFDIVPGSVSNGGVVSGNTITWNLSEITSDQVVTFQVSPKFDNDEYYASLGSTLTYTRGSNCERPGETEMEQLGGGALVTVASTAITLKSFTATSDGEQVEVQWVTASEKNTWGYHVLRSSDGILENAERVTDKMILAKGRAEGGATYSWTDTTATTASEGGSYTYWLEETELDGRILAYGPSIWIYNPQSSDHTLFLPLLQR
jgi:hypothetical protein